MVNFNENNLCSEGFYNLNNVEKLNISLAKSFIPWEFFFFFFMDMFCMTVKAYQTIDWSFSSLVLKGFLRKMEGNGKRLKRGLSGNLHC